MAHDTIFALSTGRPPAAIAVVRISGPSACAVLERLCGRVPLPRVASLMPVRAWDGSTIDDAVVLYFSEPRSATGEDVVELHVHGGRAVLVSIFHELGRMDGLRAAEPGEFTRRAFERGKIDLTEAEGLDDLIHADTEAQRRQSLRQFKGLLGQRADDWRQQIIEVQAWIEAGIDFSDEGDVPNELMTPTLARIEKLRTAIETTLAASVRGERLREGLVVAIAGPPNAGKSTLLNRLARREAAIVSPHAGTTRDVIEVQLDLDGYPVLLLDTAGIRDTSDPVEQEGVRRARVRAAEADLVLWLTEPTADVVLPDPTAVGDGKVWLIVNKVDLVKGLLPPVLGQHAGERFAISASEGQGLEALLAALGRFAADYFGSGESVLVTRARQRAALQVVIEALARASAKPLQPDEIIAEELRLASHALGRLLGKVDVEDILGKIFKDFCIGK
jgi:tRNA modification GTPase